MLSERFEAYGCHAATKNTSQAPVWGSNLFRSDSDSDPAGSTASDREPSLRAEVRARSSAPGERLRREEAVRRDGKMAPEALSSPEDGILCVFLLFSFSSSFFNNK